MFREEKEKKMWIKLPIKQIEKDMLSIQSQNHSQQL